MQLLRGAGRGLALVEASLSFRAPLPSLTGRHARSVACTGPSSAQPSFLQIQARTVTQQPLQSGNQRVVILGTGWAAGRLVQDLDCNHYDVTVVSPRNHMVYTPLLTSACVGTLDLRSVAVPIMALQKHLKDAQNNLFLASAQRVDAKQKEVLCKDEDGFEFKIPYDKLVIATGSQGSTFGIPGVDQHAHPLRDIKDAQAIKNHLLANWSKANTPGRSAQERQRLLSVLIVGGGPTGVEFAGELADFVNKDLTRLDAERASDMRITLIEAAQLLGSFDEPLREYAVDKLHQQGVHLVKVLPSSTAMRTTVVRPLAQALMAQELQPLKHFVEELCCRQAMVQELKEEAAMVKELKEEEAVLNTGEVLSYGVAVWSTGVGPTKFTTALDFAKTARGRLAVDGHLRVLEHVDADKAKASRLYTPADVKTEKKEHETEVGRDRLQQADSCWALGDCSANMENALPALAQVAEQQGKYLARQFNDIAKDKNAEIKPFVYRHLGSMASIGGNSALIQLGGQSGKHVRFKGLKSFLAWRSAYLTRLGSVQNRLYVMMNWTTTFIFGRDMSRW